MSVTMKVVQGKPQESHLEFPDGAFVIGKGPECHVRADSELISPKHCLLRVHRHDVRVFDLCTTNGTLVNGRRVEECALDSGDKLQLGTFVLEVVQKLPSPPEGGVCASEHFGDETILGDTSVYLNQSGREEVVPGWTVEEILRHAG
jgi:pSer/pThr/pTyr-binding forkhead associated (FHA) protein